MEKPNYKQLKAKWARRRKRIVKMRDEQNMLFSAIAIAIQEKGKPPVSRQQVEKLYKAEKEK